MALPMNPNSTVYREWREPKNEGAIEILNKDWAPSSPTNLDYEGAIAAALRRTVSIPMGTVCKHHLTLCLLDELERRGAVLNKTLVKALVDADDELALKHVDNWNYNDA